MSRSCRCPVILTKESARGRRDFCCLAQSSSSACISSRHLARSTSLRKETSSTSATSKQARGWQPCCCGGRRWHSHFYGWLSLKDPTEPVLTGGLDRSTLCMPSNCTTKLLRVQGKEKSRKSGADVCRCCWLISDPQPPRRADGPCAACPVVGAASQESLGPRGAGHALLPRSPSARLLHRMATTALTRVCSAFLLCCANKPHEVGKRPATSLHAAGAQPEQDREAQGGKRRDRQPRARLEEPTPKPQESAKRPTQSPSRTYLHVGVARPALLPQQTFRFHDWKGNEAVKAQSTGEGISRHRSALLCGAEPASHCRTPHSSPQPGLARHPQTGRRCAVIFL